MSAVTVATHGYTRQDFDCNCVEVHRGFEDTGTVYFYNAHGEEHVVKIFHPAHTDCANLNATMNRLSIMNALELGADLARVVGCPAYQYCYDDQPEKIA